MMDRQGGQHQTRVENRRKGWRGDIERRKAEKGVNDREGAVRKKENKRAERTEENGGWRKEQRERRMETRAEI